MSNREATPPRIVAIGRLTQGEYANLHNWVRYHLGKPRECENCSCTDSPYYDWANMSGEYKRDLSDWVRLCRVCHRLFDGHYKTSCKRGHLLDGDNLGFKSMHGKWGKYCRECNRQNLERYNQLHYHKDKAEELAEFETNLTEVRAGKTICNDCGKEWIYKTWAIIHKCPAPIPEGSTKLGEE